jgi:hypothetical protein
MRLRGIWFITSILESSISAGSSSFASVPRAQRVARVTLLPIDDLDGPSLGFRRPFAMAWSTAFGHTVTCGPHRFGQGHSSSQGNVRAVGSSDFGVEGTNGYFDIYELDLPETAVPEFNLRTQFMDKNG